MNEGLKPCPFCGGNDLHIDNSPRKDKKMWYVVCYKCGAQQLNTDIESIEEAVKAWNSRA